MSMKEQCTLTRGGGREGALKGGRLRTSKGEGEGFKGFEGEDEGSEGLG